MAAMTNVEFRSLRSKRGFAAEKKALCEEYSIMEAKCWNLVILSQGNENSTYDGLFPDGVAKALENHRANMRLAEEKLRSICL